jgi:hypothetical protein
VRSRSRSTTHCSRTATTHSHRWLKSDGQRVAADEQWSSSRPRGHHRHSAAGFVFIQAGRSR